MRMKWLTLDGPSGLCVRCQEPRTYSAGDSLVEGRNDWFLESSCRACDLDLVHTGHGFVPRPWRAQFLELTGLWRIRIDQDSETGVPILRVLRRVCGLSIPGAREMRDELVGTGWAGTRGETALLASELGGAGAGTTVTREVAGTQRAS